MYNCQIHVEGRSARRVVEGAGQSHRLGAVDPQVYIGTQQARALRHQVEVGAYIPHLFAPVCQSGK